MSEGYDQILPAQAPPRCDNHRRLQPLRHGLLIEWRARGRRRGGRLIRRRDGVRRLDGQRRRDWRRGRDGRADGELAVRAREARPAAGVWGPAALQLLVARPAGVRAWGAERDEAPAAWRAADSRVLVESSGIGGVRLIQNFNQSWKFKRADVSGAAATTFDDSSWDSVGLPHSLISPTSRLDLLLCRLRLVPEALHGSVVLVG